MRHALSACSLAVIVVVLLAGCDLRPRGNTTDVDEERLAALLAEPLLADGTAQVGGNPNTSANVTVGRGYVHVGNGPWGESGGQDGDPWLSSRAMLADVRAQGWSVTRVECTVDSSGDFSGASVIALKDLDGFTAALEARTSDGSSSLSGLAPYHDEPANPWQPADELALGESCLELPDPPTASDALGGESNLERAYLPAEG